MYSNPTVYGDTPARRNELRGEHLEDKVRLATGNLRSALTALEEIQETVNDPDQWGGDEVDMGLRHGRADYVGRQLADVARHVRDMQDDLIAATILASGYELT